ncbi:MAG: hypothetical protein HRU17_15675 [Polyangiaceae bacterium]|nr:hypothetical protein [Polyangiaceae bacterium]
MPTRRKGVPRRGIPGFLTLPYAPGGNSKWRDRRDPERIHASQATSTMKNESGLDIFDHIAPKSSPSESKKSDGAAPPPPPPSVLSRQSNPPPATTQGSEPRKGLPPANALSSDGSLPDVASTPAVASSPDSDSSPEAASLDEPTAPQTALDPPSEMLEEKTSALPEPLPPDTIDEAEREGLVVAPVPIAAEDDGGDTVVMGGEASSDAIEGDTMPFDDNGLALIMQPTPIPGGNLPPPRETTDTSIDTRTPGGPSVFELLEKNRTLIAAAAVVMLVAMYLFGRSDTGSLMITVAGPNGVQLRNLQVLVDGQVRCNESPCRVEELKKGSHLVSARAEGHTSSTETAVRVAAGESSTHQLQLERGGLANGLKVTAVGEGLSLHVDGKRLGTLPRELFDVEPGPHTIKITGERYAPYQVNLTVLGDAPTLMGPITMTPIKGLVRLAAGEGAVGADIEIDGRPVAPLPAKLILDLKTPHELVAKRSGYATLRKTLSFSAGQDVLDIEVQLSPKELAKAPAGPAQTTRAGSRASAPARASSSRGQSVLNINSVPMSRVVLDGRPLGTTPRMGVKVSPGVHTIVFTHPKHGRKVTSTQVNPGATQTIAVRFP